MRTGELELRHEVDGLDDLDCLVVRLIADCRNLRRDGPASRPRHIRDMEMVALVLLQQLAALRSVSDRFEKRTH